MLKLVQTARRTLWDIRSHIRFKLGLKPPLEHLQAETRADRFSKIYETGVWRHDRDVPGSGDGSTLEATRSLRENLPRLLVELKAKRLLDIGCGDFTWMQQVELPCDYVGVDVVPSLIEQNQRQYGTERLRFGVADAVVDELPDADVVLIREVLFHLSLKDGIAALWNILTKPRRHIVLTQDRDTYFNSDIETGDFRLLNLERAPFRLPKPDLELADSDFKDGRVLGVWCAEQVRQSLKMQAPEKGGIRQ